MTFKRLLLPLSALLILLLAVAPSGAATLDASGSGGVPTEPLFQGEGGGIVAPGDAGTGLVPDGGGAPGAEAAQEPTPTTPGGEEQPPDEEPPVDEQPPGEEGGTVNPPEGDAGTGEGSTGGFLPSTGLEVAALAAIGLGLLMAGVALRPTSTWPAPRDPLSRSTRRR